MPYVEVAQRIKGDKGDIYRLAKNMEDYPKFMEDVVSVEVVERNGNSTITAWVTNVDGRIIRWHEEDTFDDENHRIIYKQVSGDLKKFEGEWRFDAEEGETLVVLTVDFDLGIPMLAPLLNPILKKKVKKNTEAMLQALKEQIEGDSSNR